MARPAVLMTNPIHFAIRGGANPHTRSAGDVLKTVDLGRAVEQWHGYVDALLDHGVDVYVADATPDLTGMVFAANAGFLHRRPDEVSLGAKTFYPSHFTPPHRRGESLRFAAFMERFGFATGDYAATWRFEGEADAFPILDGASRRWIFTHGFRTDPEVEAWLREEIIEEPMIGLTLTDPRYYHGDTLICDLGVAAMAYLGGLDGPSTRRLLDALGDGLLELDAEDAAAFVANSFYVHTGVEGLLFASSAIADETRERIEARGVRVVPVDVSEFFGKGGGGAKCMVFNLGRIDADEPAADDVLEFRKARHVEAVRSRGEVNLRV